jgi:hypothetical protein
VGRDSDSRSIQRCWVYGRHQRSRQLVAFDRLGGVAGRAALARQPSVRSRSTIMSYSSSP